MPLSATLAIAGGQAGSLELAVVPTFGTQWLLPRQEVQRLHPDVTVNLTNRTRPFLLPIPSWTPPSISATPTGPAPRPTS